MITDEEKLVLSHLATAWDYFINLPLGHPDDTMEFRQAIHQAQNIIACRIAYRADPNVWYAQGIKRA